MSTSNISRQSRDQTMQQATPNGLQHEGRAKVMRSPMATSSSGQTCISHVSVKEALNGLFCL